MDNTPLAQFVCSRLSFFVTASHGDLTNPSITEFDGPQTRYICHQDVPLEVR